MATEIGTAYVSIVGETRQLKKDIEQAVRGKNATVNVDADTGGAAGDLARFRSTQEKNPLNIDVDVDTRGASTQLKGLRRDLEGIARSDIGKINLGAVGIASLPALAAGLAEVASAMQQVAQAGLALPGVLAGAGSSIGTLALGLSGVKDAYTAVMAASDDAATSSGDQAAQARSAASASNSLRNAVVDETQARQDVARATRDARNELADLNIEMRGGLISERRAVLEAQKAREDLASGKFTDIRDQMLRIEEADQRVLEVRERNTETAEELADANAKGVEGSDQVVAANERLTRSQQQVADAQAAVASSGPKASAAQQKSALALSKLHPEVRKLVETAAAFVSGPGMDFRNMLGGNIADGLSETLTAFTEKSLPTFEKGLGSISEVWNDTFVEMAAVLSSDRSLSLMDRIFGNTAEAQKRLNKVIDPLVDGLGTLAAAGSDSLPRMADGLEGVSKRFSNFIAKADEDGSLDKWIDEGITSLGQLGETALNVGKMFTAITKAAGVSDLLGDIESLTDGWQKFLNSAEGQQTLQDIFRKGKEEFEKWRPILEDLPGLFEGVFKAADLYTGLLVQVLDPITTLLSEHPNLVETAALAYLAFSGAKTLGAIATLTKSLSGVSSGLDVMPGKADKAARGINAAFGLIVIPAIAEMLNDELQQFLEENFPELHRLNNTNTPDQLGKKARDWFDGLGGDGNPVGPQGPLTTSGTPALPGILGGGGASSAPGQQGGNALGSDFFLGGGGQGNQSLFGGAGDSNLGTAGMSPAAQRAITTAQQNAHGQAYKYGAAGENGQYDCSGIVSSIYSAATGKNVRITTTSDFASLGFQPGYMPGALNIGSYGAGQKGHMAATLPNGVNVESSSSTGTNYGGPAKGAMDVGQQWHLPLQGFETGGPVSGKPGPDQIMAWLSDGEHVWTAEEVAAVGGQGQMQQLRQMAQAGQLNPQMLSGISSGSAQGASVPSRTEGYIPAAAGNTGKTGGGVAGSLIGLGGEAAKGAIQMAADMGKMAASMGAPGGGAGAGAGIQMGADIAKRGVDYGVDMANIGVGALSEILLPFGAPRWLSDVDPTSFMPHSGVQGAATTTAEQAVLDQQSQQGASAVDPNTTEHGQGAGAPPGPMPGPGPDLPMPGAPPTPVEPANVNNAPMVQIDTMNTQNTDQAANDIIAKSRLAVMQYGGRPYG